MLPELVASASLWKINDRVIVVRFDPFQLVGAGANGRDRNGLGHDHLETRTRRRGP